MCFDNKVDIFGPCVRERKRKNQVKFSTKKNQNTNVFFYILWIKFFLNRFSENRFQMPIKCSSSLENILLCKNKIQFKYIAYSIVRNLIVEPILKYIRILTLDWNKYELQFLLVEYLQISHKNLCNILVFSLSVTFYQTICNI